MKSISDLSVKLFADGADKRTILALSANPFIKGFTTNPTLMRKFGVTDYEGFARDVLGQITDRPVSFEVFADDFDQMERQALKIASWADNVYVKIPITNTRGESAAKLIDRLSRAGARLNVTAVLTLDQVCSAIDALRDSKAPSCISVFAGRIADTGLDPVPMMARAVELLAAFPSIELIWASPRELLNVFQADEIGCDIITATSNILDKLCLVGKDLTEYSLETVKMFYDDALASGYTL